MRATREMFMNWKSFRAPAVFAVAMIAVAALMSACGELTGPKSPSTPTDVIATLTSATSATVTWSPSPLNDGVIGYTIYRNGARVGESTTTTFEDTGLAQQTTYVYSVAANCTNGIISERSAETEQSTITTVDITAPTVTDHQPPTNFNGVSPGATVTVTFSEPMDSASVVQAISIRVTNGGAAIPATVKYNKTTRIAELTPTGGMPNPANITATVSTVAKDLANNALAAAFSWAFTTRDDTPPTVTVTNPTNNATGVAPSSPIKVTFSEAMDASTIVAANFVLTKVTGTSAVVSGAVTYDAATHVATFTPSGLAELTGYSMAVSGNVKDAAGNVMGGAYVFGFTTGDATAPTVVGVSPPNASTDIALNATVRVTFSEAMDPSSINASTVSLKNTLTSAVITTTVVYDAATLRATVTPVGPLAGNTNYTVTISTGAKDAAGNPLGALVFTTFTTLNPDTTRPTVMAVQPLNNATSVPVNSTVQVTFTEAMDPATITGTTVTLRATSPSAAVPATVTYNPATNTALLTPTASLAQGKNYTVTVTTGVTDLAGNALLTQFTSNFTTFAPDAIAPTVIGVVPTNNATGIATNATVQVTFSEAMDQATTTSANLILKNTATSAVIASTLSYDVGTNKVTITPTGPLANGTNYTLNVTTGVKDLAGNAMAAQFNSAFTTVLVADNTAPTIVSRTPGNGATGISVGTNVSVIFSEPMQQATITTTNITLTPTGGGAAIAGTMTYDAGTNTATFNPTNDLENNKSYTITVTTGVKDVAGNALASQSTSTFTTELDTTAPTVTGTSPANNATGVTVGSAVTVTFSEQMDVTTITGTTFTLKTTTGDVAVTGTVSYNGTSHVATFTPTGALTANTNYTATVTTGAKDVAGNTLLGDFTFKFTTAP
jgi:hypothetical protein